MNINTFKKGQYVLYTKNNTVAKIIDIHYNYIIPYYTISIEKKEIQTVPKYLKKINNNKKKKTKSKKIYKIKNKILTKKINYD